MFKNRPYQSEAQENCFRLWADGVNPLLGVMATGCGKTCVFAGIVKSVFPKRAMILAHRRELIWQAKKTIETITGFSVEVEMGEIKATMDKSLFAPESQVIISTIQTQTGGGDGGGRMSKFDPKDFGLLIIDEAHHSTSDSYRKVIDYYLTNPDIKILGVTATPDRSDEEALGQIFNGVAFEYDVIDAVNDGWLVEPHQYMVSIEGLDYSQVKTRLGDLNQADLARILEGESNLHGVASTTIDVAGDRRGIVFASSVNHARILSNIFNRHRHGMSNWVCGETDELERQQIIQKFARGETQVLCNYGVFTEGFDDSGIEWVSMGRPTKSRSLYAQMLGRGLRPHESIAHSLNNFTIPALRKSWIARSCKPNCTIIDFVGNSGKHKLVSSADILGGNISDEVVRETTEFARKAGKPVRIVKTLKEQELIVKERHEREEKEEAIKKHVVAKATYKLDKVDPFDLLQVRPVVSQKFDEGKQFSEAQRRILKGAGIDPDKIDYARGRQLIGPIIERRKNHKASLPQIKVLKKFGYVDIEIPFEHASQLIDAIKQNGWRRPAGFVYRPPNNQGERPPVATVDTTIDGDCPF